MAFADLKQLAQALEADGRLRRVTVEVDLTWEIACVARWALESFPPRRQFALQFDRVRGFDDPVVVGLYNSRELYARALDAAPGDLLERWSAALRQPLAPETVSSAPVKEVIDAGGDVDLGTIPIPVWTPGRDAGPYIPSAGVITKDPETGIQNMGVYRVQVQQRNRTGLFFGTDRQHGAIHYARYCARNEPMPVALVIGGPPAVQFAAAAKTAYGVDELHIAGGLLGAAVEVVPAETVDLFVPARAEYVIEGVVPPDRRLKEGPFGEALGYMNPAAPAPAIDVTAVCRRQRPLFHGYVQQLPPSEGHIVWELGTLGSLWHYLRDKMGLEDIRDLAVVRGSAGLSMLAVQLALDRRIDATQIADLLAAIHMGQKFVVLVDEDVDVHDLETVMWALTTRADPDRDVRTVEDIRSYQLDPSVLAGLLAGGGELPAPPYTASMMIIDATLKCDGPEISIPPADLMERARRRWGEYGLPELRPRPRLARLLARHGAAGDRFPLPGPREPDDGP